MGSSSCKIFFWFIILAREYVSGRPKLAIIGGDDAPQNSYTYTVSLQDSGEHICGGGIIGDKFILTAAHCVMDGQGFFEQRLLTAVIGAVDIFRIHRSALHIQTETIYVPLKNRYQDEKIDPKHRTEGDIAVLKLREPIGLRNQPHLRKLKLPLLSCLECPGREPVISGYGYNEIRVSFDPVSGLFRKDGESYGKLRFAKTKIVSQSICNSVMPRQVHESNICARVKQRVGGVPEGACDGDSGGALVRNGNVVIGILSSGPMSCSEVIRVGVYTRVGSFKSFIKNAMKGKQMPDTRVANWHFFNEMCSYSRPQLIESFYDDTDSFSEGAEIRV